MIDQYNCFILNSKSNIEKVIIFLPFSDDDTIITYNSHDKYKQQDFLKKFFTTYELGNIFNNSESEIIYSNFPLTITDKIETLQYAILKAMNITKEVLLEEMYLYAMLPLNEDPDTLFIKLTDDEYITKHSLMKFLSNVELNKNKSKMKSTKHELYNYNDFKSLNIFKDIKREKTPLTIINNNLQYVNPYKALEIVDDNSENKIDDVINLLKLKSDSSYIANRSINEFVHNNQSSKLSIYCCFVESLLLEINNQIKQKNIDIQNKYKERGLIKQCIQHYYPSLLNITNKEELIEYRDRIGNSDTVINKRQVLSSLFYSKNILTKHLNVPLKKWDNELQKNISFKNLRFEFQPKRSMFISLETLFHVLELNKETVLIKYNPGARLEKYYRIYLGNIDMRKTFIQKNK